MASESVLAAQTSSVSASLTRVDGALAVAITSVQLLPRIGASQSVRIQFTVDGARYEMQVNLFDEAFDPYTIHGGKKKK